MVCVPRLIDRWNSWLSFVRGSAQLCMRKDATAAMYERVSLMVRYGFGGHDCSRPGHYGQRSEKGTRGMRGKRGCLEAEILTEPDRPSSIYEQRPRPQSRPNQDVLSGNA